MLPRGTASSAMARYTIHLRRGGTAISIEYMASRFKIKLCMVFSHSPQPFDQQVLAPVSSYFESRVLNNPR